MSHQDLGRGWRHSTLATLSGCKCLSVKKIVTWLVANDSLWRLLFISQTLQLWRSERRYSHLNLNPKFGYIAFAARRKFACVFDQAIYIYIPKVRRCLSHWSSYIYILCNTGKQAADLEPIGIEVLYNCRRNRLYENGFNPSVSACECMAKVSYWK